MTTDTTGTAGPAGPRIDPEACARAAARLRAARETGTPCAPIRDLLTDRADGGDPEVQLAFGYRVQRLLTEADRAAGRRRCGAKIGLTAEAVQRQLGVDRPDLGVLFTDMARAQDERIGLAGLLQPKVEAEVAFTLGADLDRPEVDAEAGVAVVRAAVDTAVAALEIVDSRVAGWDIRLVDTVADNASCGLYVLGADPRPLAGLDLPAAEMTLTASSGGADEVVSTGTGAACLGDPLAALLWLARTARRMGAPLRAGDVVLSGALGPMVPVRPATTYTATIGGLGTVRATFGEA